MAVAVASTTLLSVAYNLYLPGTLQLTHQIAMTFEMQLVLFIFVALQLECNTMPQALIEAQGDAGHMSRQNAGIDGSIQCHCIYLQAKMASKFM